MGEHQRWGVQGTGAGGCGWIWLVVASPARLLLRRWLSALYYRSLHAAAAAATACLQALPLSGEGVLLELVQAPPAVIEAFSKMQ